ncbi:MAG: Peptidase family protein [Ignavibacteria bacterium]|nr:Peptidase family protein [Ignavibacteria bacterium]
MKNSITLLFVLIVVTMTTIAKPVDENTANLVGQNFLTIRTNTQILSYGKTLHLVYTAKSNAPDQETNYFYVFGSNSNGFVIVSGDDIVTPILGYSEESIFDPNNIPPNVSKWLEGYKNQIRFAIVNGLKPTKAISNDWFNIKNANPPKNVPRITSSVNPLIKTKWNQSPYYNALCPFDNDSNERTVTGCTATAMAQIMKYWNYPINGSGFHSYKHSKYGTLSANFGSTTYQWSAMPNNVSSQNDAVATLMYHCGVSVDMDYGIASTGGSGAYVISSQKHEKDCAEYALKTYFGYESTLHGLERAKFQDNEWINLLKIELNSGRPLQYAGFGKGGHTFVCDGFDDNNFFHMNWGWGGMFDGYFNINSLNPGSGGTGSGAGTYNSYQQALIGIQPPSNAITYNISLYNNVIASSNIINYGQSFQITTNFINNGTNTFVGDFCAAVFDASNNFIDYIDIKQNWSLSGGNIYSKDIIFSTNGLLSMLPGNYIIGIYFRPTGGNWSLVSSTSQYQNYCQIKVINSSDIVLYSLITVSPQTLIKGQTAFVNLNLQNIGKTTFKGEYQVCLFSLEGVFVQSIGTRAEKDGLPPNYIYSSPLIFITDSIIANPGTYLLAVFHKANGNIDWQLTGSTDNYINPIKIIVQEAPYKPDIYEPNNDLSFSTNLNVNFSNNKAIIKTTGSNIHVGNDYDFYKINLKSGFNYNINARLQDAQNSNDGKIYSIDALFFYSTDGGLSLSDAFDDVLDSNIKISGANTIYFIVSPYFLGETGTYLLDMTITRTPSVGIDETEISNSILIYPNPAKDFIILDFNCFNEKINQIKIVNLIGQEVHSSKIEQFQGTMTIPVSEFPEAVYIIELHANVGILTKKIIVIK